MSLKTIKEQIKRFISNQEPEVWCLQGGWGVGKTHLWNMCLDEMKNQKSVARNAYSYVSLFGKNNLSDLKLSLFESRETLNVGSENSLLKNMNRIKEKIFIQNSAKFFKFIPHLGGFSEQEIVEVLSSAYSSEQIVCFDDLERRGCTLTIKDVFGFALFLKEQRRCKVIIILNEDRLDQENRDQLRENLEKVVDVSLTMKLTSQEAISIAVKEPGSIYSQASKCCKILKISNIRTIRRAVRFCEEISDHLDKYEPETRERVISSVVLFSWVRDHPNDAPSVEFLKSLTSGWRFIFSDTEESDDHQEIEKWKPLLEEYGYKGADDLDIEIINSIASGYFDMEVLAPLIDNADAEVKALKADMSFNEAWDLFHESFQDNENEVCDKLYSSFLANFNHITPLNVLGTFNLLKDLGREQEAQHLVDHYVQNRSEEREFFDLDQNPFIKGGVDPYFREAFDRQRDELRENLDLKEILISLRDSWSEKVLVFLSERSEEEYRDLFHACEGKELRRVVSSALSFRTVSNPTESMSKITQKAVAALKTIGQESRINALRIRKYGIELPPDQK